MQRDAAASLRQGRTVSVTMEHGTVLFHGTIAGTMTSDGRIPVNVTNVERNGTDVPVPKRSLVHYSKMSLA